MKIVDILKDKYPLIQGILIGLIAAIPIMVVAVIDIFEYDKIHNETEATIVDTIDGRYEILSEYTQSDGNDGSIHYYIAYDKVTNVLYTIGKSEGSSPTFTVMLGESGHPIKFAGKED
ncbi:MAG: hypothetical protein IKR19_09020 [Acholeplasmatales bacterium]|nr:hypothetical protein [Acholeplasmatales bacterium]